jgi:MFS family permease
MATGKESGEDARRQAMRTSLLLAFGLTLLHMPSGLPAPLYPVYQARMGIGSATISELFATYVAGVLAGLSMMPLLLGKRQVLTSACLLSIGADLLFMVATGPAELFAAHFIQGIVLGFFTGVVPVLLADLDAEGVNKTVGRFTTSANAVGLAAGPLWSGLLLQFAPWPGRLVWAVQIGATLAIIPLMRMPESAPAGPRRRSRPPLRSIVADLAAPRAGRAALLAGFCAFGSGGLLASLGSVVLSSIVKVHSGALEGTLVSLCFVLSAVFGAIRLKLTDLAVVGLGQAWTALGALALVAAVLFASLPAMVLAALCCGVGQGFSLQGATELVAGRADADRRGPAISLFFIWCYLATALASFGVGGLIAAVGLTSSFATASGAVAALSALGLLWCRRAARPV